MGHQALAQSHERTLLVVSPQARELAKRICAEYLTLEFDQSRKLSGGGRRIRSRSLARGRNQVSLKFPKLFLRLRTKSQISDFPVPLAKWFFDNLLVDYKGLEFYHRH